LTGEGEPTEKSFSLRISETFAENAEKGQMNGSNPKKRLL
jgi:hypothetical protein